MAAAAKKDSNLLGYLLLILVVVGLSIYAYTQLDYRIEKVDKGFQGEARTNSMLLAEYFLRSMGQDAEEIKLFAPDAKTLKSSDTLMITSNRTGFDQQRAARLMQWVESGGHLIITARSISDDQRARDFILDDIGLHVEWEAFKNTDLEYNDPINAEFGDDFWLLDFSHYLHIVIEDQFDEDVLWTIERDDRLFAIEIAKGDGRLTLIPDINIFRNHNLDQHDHAAFLYSLANEQVRSSDDGVFYYSLYEEHTNLLQWLNQYAAPMMISLVIMIVIAIWMIVPRFGPLINVHQPIRRRFLDHLAAAGNYHWRKGHYPRMLLTVRKQLTQQIQTKHPEWISLTREAQVKHLSEKSGLDVVEIENALFDATIERVEHFVRKINVLEKLRKSL